MTMDANLPVSMAGFHQSPAQQSTVSEADFLARVAAFERNEEAEAKRAKESMRRMVSEQTKSTRHDRGNGPRRDRSPSTGPAVATTAAATAGIFHDFPCHFSGAHPTSQPPPQPPVAGFHIYGHHKNMPVSMYPFIEVQTARLPPLQDPYYQDPLVFASTHSHPTRRSDPAKFTGNTTGPFMLVQHNSYCPHSDLTRDTNDHDHQRGRGRQTRRPYSPDPRNSQLEGPEKQVSTNHFTHRGNAAWPYTLTPANAHGHRTPVTPAPPPHLASPLAPPTSPASLAFHPPPASKNTDVTLTRTLSPELAQQTKKQRPSFRVDYDLRTHPASLRVSPSTSSLLSRSACGHNEQSMTLICNLFPWIFEIHGSQHASITIYDILLQLHTHLHRPLLLDEWNDLTPQQRARIARAWEHALSPDGGTTSRSKRERGWREQLARCLGVNKSPVGPSHPVAGGDAAAATDAKPTLRERRYEEGILRIDLLMAQLTASRRAASQGTTTTPNTTNGLKWAGLVRDDVLARRRGLVHLPDLERCWSLLIE